MRLSSPQRDALHALYAIEQRGFTAPVPSTKLMDMINSSRATPVFSSAFRLSMATLAKNGLIHKLRDRQSLKLAYRLAEDGRATAIEIDIARAIENEQD